VAYKNNHLDFSSFLYQICIKLNKNAADGNQSMHFKAVYNSPRYVLKIVNRDVFMTSLWRVNTTGRWLTNKADATDIAYFSPLYPTIQSRPLKIFRF